MERNGVLVPDSVDLLSRGDLAFMRAVGRAIQITCHVMSPPSDEIVRRWFLYLVQDLAADKDLHLGFEHWLDENVRVLVRRGEEHRLGPVKLAEEEIRDAAGRDITMIGEFLSDQRRGLFWIWDESQGYDVSSMFISWETVVGIALLIRQEIPTGSLYCIFWGGGHFKAHRLVLFQPFSQLTSEKAKEISRIFRQLTLKGSDITRLIMREAEKRVGR